MAQITFQLHHRHKDGTRQIRASYLCSDKKYFKHPTQERVKEDNFVNQRVHGVKMAAQINARLDAEERRLWALIRSLQGEGVPVTATTLRAAINGEGMTFWKYFEAFLESPPPAVRSYETLRNYFSWRDMLLRFEKEYGKIEFRSFGQNMADRLTRYMQKNNYNDSSIKTAFKKIRAVLNYARKAQVIATVPEFTTVAKGMDASAVYLTEKEIETLYQRVQQPIDHPEAVAIKKYAEIFVLGSQIGVRVSDLKISLHNIMEKENGEADLNLSNRKGMDQVVIPLSKLAREIINKYNRQMPRFTSGRMNRLIKVACKITEFKEINIKRSMKGGVMEEVVGEKWQRVCTHTMRRSFATNMYLKGVPVYIIMLITGHKNESVFMNYIRITKQEAADIMRKHLNPDTFPAQKNPD